MSYNARLRLGLLALAFALTACGAPKASAPAGGSAASGQAAGVPAQPKILNVVLVGEPRALTMWKETTTGNIIHVHELITNALIGYNANAEPIPRLAVAPPSVEQGTWKVNPDGTMETTFNLQPNARWHDGTPFTARDVAFSWKAQVEPRSEVFVRTLRTGAVDRIDTPNDKTVVMHWQKPYGFADSLIFWDFTPLPAHVLESVFDREVNDFNQHAYWSDEKVFVGAGPYRLVRWEKGAQMELEAFDQYYLGRPKIDRIVINFVQDDNTATARVLAGEMDIAWGGAWDRANMDLVRSRGVGDFVLSRENYSHIVFQFKDMAEPIDLARDVRLRRALAHAADKSGVNQVVTDGLGIPSDSWIPPEDPRYKAAEPFIQKYSLDPQRAQQLFAEAGWTKGGDGLLRNSAGQTFDCVVRGVTGGVQAASVIADSWRAVGVDTQVEELPPALNRNLEARATYKCIEHSSRTLGRTALEHLHSSNAMFPENRYSGSNRGSYVNPALDRQIDAFFAAVGVDDRLQREREVLQTLTAEVPMTPTYIGVNKHFQKKGVTGNQAKTGQDIMNSQTWNVYEWDKQ